MKDAETIVREAGEQYRSLDLSMFSLHDIANVVLQRSRVLYDVPKGGRAVQQWAKGEERFLQDIVANKGHELVSRAISLLAKEFEELSGEIERFKPKRVADIGCGYAFIDYFIWKSLGCDLLLIDIEQTDNRNFGYRMKGAGYSDLEKAARFLQANGVPESAIMTANPEKDDLSECGKVDVAISLLSCGFHYPLSTYSPFFDENLNDGGAVIVDISNGKEWR